MDDNKRPVYNVDDYYPKRSSGYDEVSEPDEAPDAENNNYTESDDTWSNLSDRDSSYDNSSTQDHDSSAPMMRCPNCGNEVASNMNFCSLCGYHFPKEQETPYPLNNTRIDGYLVDDIAAFVGMNYQTYFRKFQKVVDGKISFNWAAMIFSNRWLAYRGMFKTAFLFSIVINAFSFVVSYIVLSMYYSAGTTISDASYAQINMFSMMLSLAIGLITGVLADSIYWKHTKRHLDQLKCQGREPWSNRKIAQTLHVRGGYKFGYALLIICFDITCNEAITVLLEKLLLK